MIHEEENRGFLFNEETGIVTQPPIPQASSGDMFILCNFPRFESAKIYEGLTGLVFIDCNLFNCIPPSDSLISGDSNIAQVDLEVENVPL